MDALLTDLQQQKLTRNFRYLKMHMDPVEVVDHLCAHDILPDSVMEDIMASHTRSEKAEKIIQAIRRKDANAYQVFVDALKASDQSFLAACLEVDAPDFLSPALDGSEVDVPLRFPPLTDSAAPLTSDGDSGEESPCEALDWQAEQGLLTVQVQPCVPARAALQLSQLTYSASHPSRGRALLVCNSVFSKDVRLSCRRGADNDLINMASLFTSLGFVVEQLRDSSRDEMFYALERERRRPEHANCGAFVLYLSSHGTADAILGTDGKELLLSNVYDLFDGRGCPPLACKPKLIIVEASRGSRVDRGHTPLPASRSSSGAAAAADVRTSEYLRDAGEAGKLSDAPSGSFRPAEQHSENSNDRGSDACVNSAVLSDLAQHGARDTAATISTVCKDGTAVPPTMISTNKADFVVAFSTFSGYTSLRSPQHGCWFSRALVEVFAKHACDCHVVELLQRVRRKMARIVTKLGHMQTCVTTETLTKDMYFLPKIDPTNIFSPHPLLSGQNVQ